MRGPSEEESRAETRPSTRSVLWARSGFLGTMGWRQGGRGGWLGAERIQAEKSGSQGRRWGQQSGGQTGFCRAGSVLRWRDVLAEF